METIFIQKICNQCLNKNDCNKSIIIIDKKENLIKYKCYKYKKENNYEKCR